MSKIFVNDNASQKFSGMIMEEWTKQGHEVRFELGANPEVAQDWADIVFVDFLDNNAYCYFNNFTPIKKLFVRAIDIDVWMGRHRDPKFWNYISGLITISEPLYRKVQKEALMDGCNIEDKLHLVRPGVDVDKFTFKKRNGSTHKIAMVTGDFWEMKNYIEGFRIFQMLQLQDPGIPWELHIRGQHHSRDMEQVMKEHIVNRQTPGVFIYDQVDDMNEWYEDKDFILIPSLKEAFSYAGAEAMAKGIKPIFNNWWGSDTIWPKKYLYNNLFEALDMFKGEYNSEEYRQYIEENYTLDRMMKGLNEVMSL